MKNAFVLLTALALLFIGSKAKAGLQYTDIPLGKEYMLELGDSVQAGFEVQKQEDNKEYPSVAITHFGARFDSGLPNGSRLVIMKGYKVKYRENVIIPFLHVVEHDSDRFIVYSDENSDAEPVICALIDGPIMSKTVRISAIDDQGCKLVTQKKAPKGPFETVQVVLRVPKS